MKKTKRKGIWIPNYILEDEKLDAINKIILAEIHSLAELEKGCYASDEHFAKLVGIERPSANKRIKKIVEMGYLTKRTIKGRGKYLYPKEHVDSTSPVPVVTNTSSFDNEELVPISTNDSSVENTINTVINSDILEQELVQNTNEDYVKDSYKINSWVVMTQAQAARSRISKLKDEIVLAARDGNDIIQNYKTINKNKLWDYVESRIEYDRVLPMLNELVYLSNSLYGK